MEKVICDKCGTEMKPINPQTNSGMICPECGWGWATTPSNPMLEDEKIYNVTLLTGNSISEENVKTVSKIIAQNYLFAKKAIENAPTLLLSGKAREVHKIISELEANSILYEVSPHYPYKISKEQ